MEKWYPAPKQPDGPAVVRVYQLHRATLDAERRASRPSATPEARSDLRAALQTEQEALREFDFETFGAFSAEYDEESLGGLAGDASIAGNPDLDGSAPSESEVENDALRQRVLELQEQLTQTQAAQQQLVSTADSRSSDARASIAALEDENARLRSTASELVAAQAVIESLRGELGELEVARRQLVESEATIAALRAGVESGDPARNEASRETIEMFQLVRADLEALREQQLAQSESTVASLRASIEAGDGARDQASRETIAMFQRVRAELEALHEQRVAHSEETVASLRASAEAGDVATAEREAMRRNVQETTNAVSEMRGAITELREHVKATAEDREAANQALTTIQESAQLAREAISRDAGQASEVVATLQAGIAELCATLATTSAELRELHTTAHDDADRSRVGAADTTQPTRRCLPLSIADHVSREMRRTTYRVVRPISKLIAVRS